MTKRWENEKRVAIGGGKPRSKGWTSERRARQAALIRGWQPWRRSTGPKTEAGKVRCAMNALKHGFRSRANILEYRRVRNAIRMAALNNEILRLFIRMRDGRPDFKPTYAMRLSMATECLRQFLEKVRPEKISKSNEQTIGNGNSPTRPISYGGPWNARMGRAALAPQAIVASNEGLSSGPRTA